MFTTLISDLTDAEIAADIRTCETILRTGYFDGECEDYYREWLEDLVNEQNIRANPEDYETPVSVRRAA